MWKAVANYFKSTVPATSLHRPPNKRPLTMTKHSALNFSANPPDLSIYYRTGDNCRRRGKRQDDAPPPEGAAPRPISARDHTYTPGKSIRRHNSSPDFYTSSPSPNAIPVRERSQSTIPKSTSQKTTMAMTFTQALLERLSTEHMLPLIPNDI
ncbi:hypothetical protein DID78_01420 [Candidatus Marinamargulisbacteria bacterium SCGC AG-343-D04]|nr:hypothetical protein DID78_01420 [Candidatus Marinamargulisbacteria bacterium SCGC AG-343-D04]